MHRFGLRNSLAAVVVMLSVLAGCADDEGGEEAGPAPTSPSTTVPDGGCVGGDVVPPDGAAEVSEVNADVDGDRAADRVLAYHRTDGVRRVAVQLATGATAAVDASATQVEGPAPLSVLGGVDLGGNGDTVVAVTGAGASVVIIGLFQFVECALTRVSFESGEAVDLPISGAITHGDGARCADAGDGRDGPFLVRLSATSTDGETFTATETGYKVDGNTLVEVGSQTTTLIRGADDEEINSYYTLDCPALENTLGNL